MSADRCALAGHEILFAVRMATRASLAAVGAGIILLGVVAVIAAVLDGETTRIAGAVVTGVLLAMFGLRFVRAAVRYEEGEGSA
jgi:hypothetical protein